MGQIKGLPDIDLIKVQIDDKDQREISGCITVSSYDGKLAHHSDVKSLYDVGRVLSCGILDPVKKADVVYPVHDGTMVEFSYPDKVDGKNIDRTLTFMLSDLDTGEAEEYLSLYCKGLTDNGYEKASRFFGKCYSDIYAKYDIDQTLMDENKVLNSLHIRINNYGMLGPQGFMYCTFGDKDVSLDVCETYIDYSSDLKHVMDDGIFNDTYPGKNLYPFTLSEDSKVMFEYLNDDSKKYEEFRFPADSMDTEEFKKGFGNFLKGIDRSNYGLDEFFMECADIVKDKYVKGKTGMKTNDKTNSMDGKDSRSSVLGDDFAEVVMPDKKIGKEIKM